MFVIIGFYGVYCILIKLYSFLLDDCSKKVNILSTILVSLILRGFFLILNCIVVFKKRIGIALQCILDINL